VSHWGLLLGLPHCQLRGRLSPASESVQNGNCMAVSKISGEHCDQPSGFPHDEKSTALHPVGSKERGSGCEPKNKPRVPRCQGCHGAKGALCYDHWAAFRRLDLEASRNWILSNAHARTMGHGSFILCKLCLAMPGFIFPPVSLNLVEYNPGFYHLAWGCPCRPNPLEPPDNILLARFGWSSLVIFGWSFGFVPISNACANPSGPTATVAQPPLGGARTL
jgi:hypothetical protein